MFIEGVSRLCFYGALLVFAFALPVRLGLGCAFCRWWRAGGGGAQDGIRSCGLLHLPFHCIPVVSTGKESGGVKREI